MNKRPNFGLSNTAMAGSFALQTLDGNRPAVKPWDGNKTGTGPAKKPFEFRGSNTDYGQSIGYAAKERELTKDLQNLDWELKSMANPSKPAFQSEANFKPNLFIKKKAVETRETKATASQPTDEWDLPEAQNSAAKIAYKPSNEKSAEASEWNLGKFESLAGKPRADKAKVSKE